MALIELKVGLLESPAVDHAAGLSRVASLLVRNVFRPAQTLMIRRFVVTIVVTDLAIEDPASSECIPSELAADCCSNVFLRFSELIKVNNNRFASPIK